AGSRGEPIAAGSIAPAPPTATPPLTFDSCSSSSSPVASFLSSLMGSPPLLACEHVNAVPTSLFRPLRASPRHAAAAASPAPAAPERQQGHAQTQQRSRSLGAPR